MRYLSAVTLSLKVELPHNLTLDSLVTLVAAVVIIPVDVNAELNAE